MSIHLRKEPAVEVLDERLRALVGELAELINQGEGEQRERLRDTAIELLRDEVSTTEAPVIGEVGAGTPAFNPFGISIPLFLAGGVLIVLFPPVGLLLLGGAGLTMVWGVLVALLRRAR